MVGDGSDDFLYWLLHIIDIFFLYMVGFLAIPQSRTLKNFFG